MPNNKEQLPGHTGPKEGAKTTHPLDLYSVQSRNDDGKDSPFYASPAPVISLPKGGGALKGIDEQFSVNVVNGTAGLELPLPLTPGRGGFSPGLSIHYNSGGGNSTFGLGWNLSLPSIRRKTDKKLPLYRDDIESDVFLMAGAEDLVPALSANGEEEELISDNAIYFIKRYLPRIEGLFARIEYIKKQGHGAGWWRVTTKDNITTYYGVTTEGRIAEPEYPERIFQWLPQLSTDHKGNIILYRYAAENLLGVEQQQQEQNRLNGRSLFSNTYLKRVQYCNRNPWFVPGQQVYEPVLPHDADFLMEAVLDYGDHSAPYYSLPDQEWKSRSDAFSVSRAGFEIRTYRKCKRVLMFHHFDELTCTDGERRYSANLVRSLELEYKNDHHSGRLSEVDMIVSATQRGYLFNKKNWAWHDKALPSVTFNYTPLQWDNTVHTVSKEDFTPAPQGLTGAYQWVDFEGEGISGILTEQGGGWFYKNNLGNGRFAPAKNVGGKPPCTGLDTHLQWQDLDADGCRQVVTREGLEDFRQLGDDQQWHAFANNLNINWDSPFTKMIDLDGDGRPDLLLTEDRAWTWYHNEGKAGYSQGGEARIFTDEEKGPVLLLRDKLQSIFLADMNGDGLADLVRIKSGEICYWPNMGYGKFGAKVSMDNAPALDTTDGYQPMYLSLADITGTGTADLIYLGQNNCTVWINLCGNGWSEARRISSLPATDPYSKIAVLDFLGKGTGCVVWSSPLPQHVHAPMRYIDLLAGQKPYLLRRYDNGMGKSVSLTYKSSTQYYLEDTKNGYPWATRLPFPVHCIHTVTTADEVSETSYTQSYQYRHGYYDHEERAFHGFGYVERLDMEKAVYEGSGEEILAEERTLDQPPVCTKTWNHTGAWMRQCLLTAVFKEEYFLFPEWDEQVLVAGMPHGLKTQELREAHRALKGLPLRQELYALDGSEAEGIPYAVTANAYAVKRIQPLGENRFASFLSYKQQSLTFSCERNSNDPRILQELILQTDEYGNVLQSAKVAYPRKEENASLPEKVKFEQRKMHVTCSENTFTNDITGAEGHYRLRLPYETKDYELLGYSLPSGLWKPGDLLRVVDAAVPLDFAGTPTEGIKQKRLLAHRISLFQSNAADGTRLPAGQLDSLAIAYQSYQKAFSAALLAQCYDTRISEAELKDGGYADILENGTDLYWLPLGTVQYKDSGMYPSPEQQFYTPVSFIDPWGNATTVHYWKNSDQFNYWLLPQSTTDPLHNTNRAIGYDWRILQPCILTDANENSSEILYDALGMPVAMALSGKGNEGDGLYDAATGNPSLDIFNFSDAEAQDHFFEVNPDDATALSLLGNATWRCVYRLEHLPVAVGMIARTRHVADLERGETPGTLLRLSYTDGLGRLIMHKTPCEPTLENKAKAWIGSGRTVYNNKGNAVLQYESYFSDSHECDTAEQAAHDGVSPKLFYDPLNRVYRIEMPDGTFTKTEWTAWEQQLWDANDTVMESSWYHQRMVLPAEDPERKAAEKAAAHYDTPVSIHTDSLARPFYTLQLLVTDPVKAMDCIHSYVNLDIQGNRLSVIEGNRITASPTIETLVYRYDMLQQPCYQYSIDSGAGRMFMDAAGQPVCAWDAEDRKFSMSFDAGRRLKEKRVKEAVPMAAELLLEKTEYGEGLPEDQLRNLRGRPYAHYDGGGKHWLPLGYDFKGNPITTCRSLTEEKTAADVDWNVNQNLEPPYSSTAKQDALNRMVQMTDPGGNVTSYVYDRGGALKQVMLNAEEYVSDIHYNANGQRHAIWYGNGTKTRYTYDPLTYRLRKLHTLKVKDNRQWQHLCYYYDPAGNITHISDKVQPDIFYNNTMVVATQQFTYDALYRLIEARGRELAAPGLSGFGPEEHWSDALAPGPAGSNAARNYIQSYTYDAAGNILTLRHCAGSGSYTRLYTYDTGSNRLYATALADGISVAGYTGYAYDTGGNMTAMPHLETLLWNKTHELNKIKRTGVGGVEAWYQYSGGHRIRKYVKKGIVTEERVYLGNFEVYRKFEGSNLKVCRTTVPISDNSGRIALLEVKDPLYGEDNSLPVLKRYIYANHLGSASLELDHLAALISYEEYHPYGTSAYRADSASIHAVARRYRYTDKERDEESGLYYHGARYYIPWLCRWTAVDPLESVYAGKSPYHYCDGNPVMIKDPTGKGGEAVFADNKINIDVDFVVCGNYASKAGSGRTPEQKQQHIRDDIDNYEKMLKGNDFNKKGDNAYMQERYLGTSTCLQELFAHALGSRSSAAHVDKVAGQTTVFNIRTHKFTAGVDPKCKEKYFDPGKKEEVDALKEIRSVVTQDGIDLIKPFGDWGKQASDATWKAWVSGIGNAFFNDKLDVEEQYPPKIFNSGEFRVNDKKVTSKKVFSFQ